VSRVVAVDLTEKLAELTHMGVLPKQESGDVAEAEAWLLLG
jgi:hypothetical protein